ncbi:MAG: tryptophan synthase subunit alpha, partial [Actinomycetota bacterium]|nr:tryptophan synthase subunit alpha [Actinomycetota bacterium]
MTLLTVGAGLLTSVGSSSAAVTGVKGSAFGYEAQISLFGGVQPHDGPSPTVTLVPPGSATAVTATAPSGIVKHGPANFFTSDALDVSTQGTTGPSGSVTSSSNVKNVNRATTQPSATGSEIFSADNVHSTCTTSATTGAVSGSATFTNATLQTESGIDGNPSHPRVE